MYEGTILGQAYKLYVVVELRSEKIRFRPVPRDRRAAAVVAASSSGTAAAAEQQSTAVVYSVQ